MSSRTQQYVKEQLVPGVSKALQSTEMSGTTCLTTKCHMPESLNPYQHRCEKLKSHILTYCWIIAITLYH